MANGSLNDTSLIIDEFSLLLLMLLIILTIVVAQMVDVVVGVWELSIWCHPRRPRMIDQKCEPRSVRKWLWPAQWHGIHQRVGLGVGNVFFGIVFVTFLPCNLILGIPYGREICFGDVEEIFTPGTRSGRGAKKRHSGTWTFGTQIDGGLVQNVHSNFLENSIGKQPWRLTAGTKSCRFGSDHVPFFSWVL